MIDRRGFIVMTGMALAPAGIDFGGTAHMYGLIGKMNAVPGQREALIGILIDASSTMPGCLSYVVAKDATDPNAIWVTEVWKDEASHKASLSLPAVQQAIAKGRPMIAGFGERFVTEPVGGAGLRPARP